MAMLDAVTGTVEDPALMVALQSMMLSDKEGRRRRTGKKSNRRGAPTGARTGRVCVLPQTEPGLQESLKKCAHLTWSVMLLQ
jgi:hypothetical protein